MEPLRVEFPAPQMAVIRFTRPRERNPLSLATLRELENALAALIPRRELKAIIFTGDEDVFCAGANLREIAALTPATAPAFARRGQRIFHAIAAAPQLTIAAINGYCFGGGFDLALSCKIRVAAPEAVFAHPGVNLGIITGWGGTQRLTKLIGRARTLDILLTGRRVNAQEALQLGLINKIGTPALACALSLL